jgi:transporter family protein
MPRWLIHTLLTMLLWGGWGVVSKPLADILSPWQLQALSALGPLPVACFLVLTQKGRLGPNSRRGFLLAFASGAIASVGNVAYYQALATGGKAAAVTPLAAMYPLVTIILALVFLGERLNATQGTGVLLSLVAIYLFNVGSGAAWLNPWLALVLIPIGLWGVAALLQKLATNTASSERVTAAFLLGALPVSLLIPLWAPMNWGGSAQVWGLVVVLGLLFGLGNLTLIYAYGLGGQASVVTPLASLYSLVTIPLAVLLLGEHIGGREGLGIVLALLAVVALGYETPRLPPPPGKVRESPASCR